MLKKFFSYVLGSFVGAWLALGVFSFTGIIAGFVFLGAMAGDLSSSMSAAVQENSVLYINMASAFDERSNGDEAFDAILNEGKRTSSTLDNVLKALRVAKDNSKIKGVFIECNVTTAGIATLYEIRKALQDFKQSGKFVYAYGNSLITQGDYYVASVADEIRLNPIGAVDIHGLSSTVPFMKNLLDKAGIEMQVVRVGTFKSAVEPYILTEASEANRTAMLAYMNSIWGNICDSLSTARDVPVAQWNAMADSMLLTQDAAYLEANKLVDGFCYRFEMIDFLKEKSGLTSADDLRLVNPEQVAALELEKPRADKVAVVYAVGEIDGTSEGIDSESLSKEIINIANDDAVKAVVLRVNSPGGSAYGSEQIWAALEEVKKAGKPFAVSMGDMAASGGYYISCGADRIFAEPVTITGSIGIFGLIPCFKDLLNDKLGVNLSVINTNENGNFISTTSPMTPAQQAAMQRMINEGYELFTKRCAEGRGMAQDSLKLIAEGRVWDGITAKNIGLVDEFGGIEDAIDWVVEQGKIGEYNVSVYPKLEPSFMRYMRGYMSMQVDKVMEAKVGELYKYRNIIDKVKNRDHVQCIMEPVEVRL